MASMSNAKFNEIRSEFTQKCLGVSAEEFIVRWWRGDYRDRVIDPDLMDLLAWFPELD